MAEKTGGGTEEILLLSDEEVDAEQAAGLGRSRRYKEIEENARRAIKRRAFVAHSSVTAFVLVFIVSAFVYDEDFSDWFYAGMGALLALAAYVPSALGRWLFPLDAAIESLKAFAPAVATDGLVSAARALNRKEMSAFGKAAKAAERALLLARPRTYKTQAGRQWHLAQLVRLSLDIGHFERQVRAGGKTPFDVAVFARRAIGRLVLDAWDPFPQESDTVWTELDVQQIAHHLQQVRGARLGMRIMRSLLAFTFSLLAASAAFVQLYEAL